MRLCDALATQRCQLSCRWPVARARAVVQPVVPRDVWTVAFCEKRRMFEVRDRVGRDSRLVSLRRCSRVEALTSGSAVLWVWRGVVPYLFRLWRRSQALFIGLAPAAARPRPP